MRISDWSSDVCSSDLANPGKTVVERVPARRDMPALRMAESVHGLAAGNDADADPGSDRDISHRIAVLRRAQPCLGKRGGVDVGVDGELGRASCRDSVWQYV